MWPRPADHLFSCWAFSLSLHSLWTLPPAVAHHGGLAFLLAYAAAVALVGAPLLLLEVGMDNHFAKGFSYRSSYKFLPKYSKW